MEISENNAHDIYICIKIKIGLDSSKSPKVKFKPEIWIWIVLLYCIVTTSSLLSILQRLLFVTDFVIIN